MDLKDEILKQIKKYKLASMGYEVLVSQLTVLNNKPYTEVKGIVDNLIGNGKLKIKQEKPQDDPIIRNFKRDKQIGVSN